ncbi:MAG TPA: Hsp70 family protein, partial [Planctomycetia bacterium]|nr:Hsp70 family protein [Planctomycetia bacterium]
LKHLRDAWNHEFASLGPKAQLQKQRVVLTVPASFDEAARELTVEAAQAAGFENMTLLEEPQAAFYDWMRRKDPKPLAVGDVCVVVDCGGGTTDFSLIAVSERKGQPEFERLAVGEHLLLGGDNIDFAIARHVEQVVSPGRRLDPSQWGNLVQACRLAKEVSLAPDGPPRLTVSVMGRGSKVIGQTLKCDLERTMIRQIALDGFLPFVPFDEEPKVAARGALQEFGLPYVSDPAITRHLAAFLRQHAAQMSEASGDEANASRPAAVLFNGGVFNAQSCRDRIIGTLQAWFGTDWKPRILELDSLDLAVARGAAYYAWAKESGAKRIKSGAARSYYVGLGGGTVKGKTAVLCLVPHGLEEGKTLQIEKPQLELRVGEPVSFPLFASTIRPKDRAGQVVNILPGQMHELPALQTVLRRGKRAGGATIAVRLEATLTEIGTLDLFCAARDGNAKWKLQLQARSESAPGGDPGAAQGDGDAGAVAVAESWSEEELGAAEGALKTALSGSDTLKLDQLPKTLESALGISRLEWPGGLLRALWEPLRLLAKKREISPEHESRWMNLAGFFLRPGRGDRLDPFRIEQLWKLCPAGPVHDKSDRAWTEYWILYRRAAGGLDANRQMELANRLVPLAAPGAKKPPRRVGAAEYGEAWRTLASLERLPAALKTQLGRELLSRLPETPHFLFWVMGRLGARIPTSGPLNETVSREEVHVWIDQLMNVPARLAGEWSFCLAQLGRMSGDRARDIDDDLRARLIDALQRANAKPEWIRMLEEMVELEGADVGKLLGDSLPPGLRLMQGD